MLFSYHIRYTFRNQAKDTFILSADLHQKSRSGSNQYKFLVVRVLCFWELGRSEVCLRFVRSIKKTERIQHLLQKQKLPKQLEYVLKN